MKAKPIITGAGGSRAGVSAVLAAIMAAGGIGVAPQGTSRSAPVTVTRSVPAQTAPTRSTVPTPGRTTQMPLELIGSGLMDVRNPGRTPKEWGESLECRAMRRKNKRKGWTGRRGGAR